MIVKPFNNHFKFGTDLTIIAKRNVSEIGPWFQLLPNKTYFSCKIQHALNEKKYKLSFDIKISEGFKRSKRGFKFQAKLLKYPSNQTIDRAEFACNLTGQLIKGTITE